MSKSVEDADNKGSNSPAIKLSQFPESARNQIRDDLQRIRLQLEALSLTAAEKDVRVAIVSACNGLEIPTHLSVRQLSDLME